MSINIQSIIDVVNGLKSEIYLENKPPEEITFEHGLQSLPLNLFAKTRGFLQKVAIQINHFFNM